MAEHPHFAANGLRDRLAPTGTVARLRRPLAILLRVVLLSQWSLPAFAETGSPPPPPASGTAGDAVAPDSGAAAPPSAPGTGEAPEGASSLLAGGPEGGGAPPLTTFSLAAFQTDLFTGAATAEIPLLLPPGTAGGAPKVGLRYHSGAVDELDKRQQAPWTGLGGPSMWGASSSRTPRGRRARGTMA